MAGAVFLVAGFAMFLMIRLIKIAIDESIKRDDEEVVE